MTDAAPLDYQQAADRLGVSVRTLKRCVAQRRVPCMRLGHRTVRFRPADLERFKARLAGEGVAS